MSIDADIAIAALVAGIGTYLLRFLPMKVAEALNGLGDASAFGRFLAGVGPAAIMALLAVSLLGLIEPSGLAALGPAACIAAGLGAVYLIHRRTRNIAFATLAGAMTYGAFAGLLAG